MLNFLKNYPMSILLAIIALNLYSIGQSLKVESKINGQKLECSRMLAYAGNGDVAVNYANILQTKYDLLNYSMLSQYCRNIVK